jgi:hypothetical protein|nr:MAG TPA: hypothetical protein [Caudoviricetes sp.]
MDYQDRLKLMNELMKESETVVTTDSNSDIIKSNNNNTDSNPVENGTEEHFDVMTEQGYINQLNRLYSKGTIDKEYYLEQVKILKNNYPISYELIKDKLLMN